jgi:hypothetical protein
MSKRILYETSNLYRRLEYDSSYNNETMQKREGDFQSLEEKQK